ncbi:VanZ family protein [Aureimonas psammosilenae]|uniref:VanZ family protein n=1 Tax=Aureimonas psammosilenae TaxID=2495496 RepID=UPI00126129E8|nr:VanZ family protein [Aureimonas psammosilenae]
MNVVRTVRIAALIGAASGLGFVAYVTLSPIEQRPVIAGIGIEHVAAFGVIGGLFGLAFPRRVLPSFLFVIACAACLEAAQHLVPGRHGRWVDLGMKALGSCLGFGGAMIVNAVARRLPGGDLWVAKKYARKTA